MEAAVEPDVEVAVEDTVETADVIVILSSEKYKEIWVRIIREEIERCYN